MLNENIKKHRKIKGFTQKQLADTVGISRAFMSLIEKGTNKPSDENLEKIAKALGVTVNSLLISDATDPTEGIIDTLIELTKKNKIKWDLVRSEIDNYGEPLLNRYESKIKNVNYILQQNFFDDSESGLFTCEQDKMPKFLADFKNYPRINKLWEIILYGVNDKAYIYNYLDDLKDLLKED